MNKFKLIVIGFILIAVLIIISFIKGLIVGDPDAYIFLFLIVVIGLAYSRKKNNGKRNN